MDMHECGGEKSYALFGIAINESCQCDHSDEHHSKDCCKDKKVKVKADKKDKSFGKQLIQKYKTFEFNCQSPLLYNLEPVQQLNSIAVIYKVEHPPGYARPLYILFDSFLI
jgi:hypothetical protein